MTLIHFRRRRRGTAFTHGLYNLVEAQSRVDATKDFDCVAVLGGAPVALAVSTSMLATLKAAIEASKKAAGKCSFGSPGTGTLLHVATERLLQMTDGQFTPVPYTGSGPATQDLMGGPIDMAVGTLGNMQPLHRSERM